MAIIKNPIHYMRNLFSTHILILIASVFLAACGKSEPSSSSSADSSEETKGPSSSTIATYLENTYTNDGENIFDVTDIKIRNIEIGPEEYRVIFRANISFLHNLYTRSLPSSINSYGGNVCTNAKNAHRYALMAIDTYELDWGVKIKDRVTIPELPEEVSVSVIKYKKGMVSEVNGEIIARPALEGYNFEKVSVTFSAPWDSLETESDIMVLGGMNATYSSYEEMDKELSAMYEPLIEEYKKYNDESYIKSKISDLTLETNEQLSTKESPSNSEENNNEYSRSKKVTEVINKYKNHYRLKDIRTQRINQIVQNFEDDSTYNYTFQLDYLNQLYFFRFIDMARPSSVSKSVYNKGHGYYYNGNNRRPLTPDEIRNITKSLDLGLNIDYAYEGPSKIKGEAVIALSFTHPNDPSLRILNYLSEKGARVATKISHDGKAIFTELYTDTYTENGFPVLSKSEVYKDGELFARGEISTEINLPLDNSLFMLKEE